MRIVNVAVAGLGNMGRRILSILDDRQAYLLHRQGIDFRVTACADSSGYIADTAGLPVKRVIDFKSEGGKLAAYDANKEGFEGGRGFSQGGDAPPAASASRRGKAGPAAGQKPGTEAQAAWRSEFLGRSRADILLDLTPTNPLLGEPGLSLVTEAISHGINIVMADKGPLALRYPELEALAKERGVGLYFSAACGGGLPILSIGRRDLAGARIETFEGVLTHTTNIILSGMSEGQNWDEAWSRALSVGQAETDPRLDISGLDSAAKLCIVANAVLGRPARIHDVSVTGIQGIDQERVRDVRRNGRELKLVCRARREGQGYLLSVAPEELDAAHPLARIGQGSVAAIFDTDVSGRFFTELSAPDPGPAARLVMADMIDSVKAS